MPSAWKRWWRNNLNKLKKKNKNRPVYDRDFNDDDIAGGRHVQQQTPYMNGSGERPLSPGSTQVARDPFDRFAHTPTTAAPTRPPQHGRTASYSRLGQQGRPKSADSSDSSDSFRTAPQAEGFKC